MHTRTIARTHRWAAFELADNSGEALKGPDVLSRVDALVADSPNKLVPPNCRKLVAGAFRPEAKPTRDGARKLQRPLAHCGTQCALQLLLARGGGGGGSRRWQHSLQLPRFRGPSIQSEHLLSIGQVERLEEHCAALRPGQALEDLARGQAVAANPINRQDPLSHLQPCAPGTAVGRHRVHAHKRGRRAVRFTVRVEAHPDPDILLQHRARFALSCAACLCGFFHCFSPHHIACQKRETLAIVGAWCRRAFRCFEEAGLDTMEFAPQEAAAAEAINACKPDKKDQRPESSSKRISVHLCQKDLRY